MNVESRATGHDGRSCRRGEAGLSLVEVLIAAALLLAIAIGILPLFAQSIVSNLAGQDATTAANFARSRLEEFEQLPFSDARMEILAGTERQYDENWSQRDEVWRDGVSTGWESLDPTANVTWDRTTVVRQYNATDLDTPLVAGVDPGQIHIKEIEVTVASTRTGGPMGVGKSVSVRVYKAD